MKKLSLLLVLFAALVVFVPTHAHAAAKKPESFCDNVASHPDFGEGDTGNDLWSIGCHDGYQGAQHAPPKPESFCDNVASHPDFGEGDTGNDLWSIGCHDGYQGAQPATVSNPPGPDPVVTNPSDCGDPGEIDSVCDVLRVIDRITNWMFTIFIAVAVIMVLLAAFTYITAGGGEETAKAHKMLLYSAVAIAVAILAKGVVNVVKLIVK